jgi:peptidoglycan/LPS O-acetylase OafA/YrhL
MYEATEPMQEDRGQSQTRFVGAEGLRGLAAGGVLLSHVYLYASPDGERYDLGLLSVLPRTSGTAGVVLFFTLSAFLLYRPFAAALLMGRSSPSIRRYLQNRALRIFPAYWLAVIGTGVVLKAAYLPPLEVQGRSLASEPGVLVTNLLLVQSWSPDTLLTGIGPAWSLGVELVFYLALPVLAAGAVALARRTGPGRCWPVLAALAPVPLLLVLGQLGYRLAAHLPEAEGGSWGGSWHAVVTRSFLAQCGLFAAGLTLAVLHVQVERGRLRLPSWWRSATGAGAVVLAVPVTAGFDAHLLSENQATLGLSVACAMLLSLIVLPRSRGGWLAGILSSRLLVSFGVVSYGVFLWHEPLVWFLRRHHLTAEGTDGFLLSLALTLASTVVVSILSWRLVEKPALSLKRSSASNEVRRAAH